ncbi:hypothetical protein ILYODFUR_036108, partial [Ilyodon furcidens]
MALLQLVKMGSDTSDEMMEIKAEKRTRHQIRAGNSDRGCALSQSRIDGTKTSCNMKKLMLLGIFLSALHISNSQKQDFCRLPSDA